MDAHWQKAVTYCTINSINSNPGAIPNFRTYRRIGLNVERKYKIERNYKISPVRWNDTHRTISYQGKLVSRHHDCGQCKIISSSDARSAGWRLKLQEKACIRAPLPKMCCHIIDGWRPCKWYLDMPSRFTSTVVCRRQNTGTGSAPHVFRNALNLCVVRHADGVCDAHLFVIGALTIFWWFRVERKRGVKRGPEYDLPHPPPARAMPPYTRCPRTRSARGWTLRRAKSGFLLFLVTTEIKWLVGWLLGGRHPLTHIGRSSVEFR